MAACISIISFTRKRIFELSEQKLILFAALSDLIPDILCDHLLILAYCVNIFSCSVISAAIVIKSLQHKAQIIWLCIPIADIKMHDRIEKLQQISLYYQLGLKRDEIRDIMLAPNYDSNRILERNLTMLPAWRMSILL